MIFFFVLHFDDKVSKSCTRGEMGPSPSSPGAGARQSCAIKHIKKNMYYYV